MNEIITKTSSKLREILSEDNSPYLSAGRVGMFVCLLFSMGISLVGLKFASNNNILNYCSLIALQFLGTAVLFYGSTKTSEAFKAKWTPDPVAMDSKITTIVNKVVSVGDAKLQQSSTTTETAPKEEPELEEVK